MPESQPPESHQQQPYGNDGGAAGRAHRAGPRRRPARRRPNGGRTAQRRADRGRRHDRQPGPRAAARPRRLSAAPRPRRTARALRHRPDGRHRGPRPAHRRGRPAPHHRGRPAAPRPRGDRRAHPCAHRRGARPALPGGRPGGPAQPARAHRPRRGRGAAGADRGGRGGRARDAAGRRTDGRLRHRRLPRPRPRPDRSCRSGPRPRRPHTAAPSTSTRTATTRPGSPGSRRWPGACGPASPSAPAAGWPGCPRTSRRGSPSGWRPRASPWSACPRATASDWRTGASRGRAWPDARRCGCCGPRASGWPPGSGALRDAVNPVGRGDPLEAAYLLASRGELHPRRPTSRLRPGAGRAGAARGAGRGRASPRSCWRCAASGLAGVLSLAYSRIVVHAGGWSPAPARYGSTATRPPRSPSTCPASPGAVRHGGAEPIPGPGQPSRASARRRAV